MGRAGYLKTTGWTQARGKVVLYESTSSRAAKLQLGRASLVVSGTWHFPASAPARRPRVAGCLLDPHAKRSCSLSICILREQQHDSENAG